VALKFGIHLRQINPKISRLKVLKLHYFKLDILDSDHLPKEIYVYI
jgi:hypothetical protein